MTNISTARRARGIALMFAIFMIVTLAAIGLYLVTVTTGQTRAVTQDELAVRAYQAARAGIEWGVFQVLRANSCAVGTTGINFTAGGLNGFRAEVTCSLVVGETEGAETVNVYNITSRGCNVGNCTVATPGSTYVERELFATVARAP